MILREANHRHHLISDCRGCLDLGLPVDVDGHCAACGEEALEKRPQLERGEGTLPAHAFRRLATPVISAVVPSRVPS
jgi:hypothetical protein